MPWGQCRIECKIGDNVGRVLLRLVVCRIRAIEIRDLVLVLVRVDQIDHGNRLLERGSTKADRAVVNEEGSGLVLEGAIPAQPAMSAGVAGS